MAELKTFYFDLAHAIKVHDMIIDISGGRPGHDPQKVQMLGATLEHIQNDLYYPTFLDKIAHLLYSINKSHAFIDGNKRSSLALSAYFL
jgi:death-on-curing protein